ncbi:MAG: hypothetical protein RLZZ507_4285 [Cyanobacteriota bacterium]|jgi:hypothetical protein
MNSIQAQKNLTDRELIIFNSELDRKRKSTTIAYILYFFLGSIGGHKFYIGKPIMGLLYIILLFSGCFLELGGVASAYDTSITSEDASIVLAVGLLPLGLLGIMMLLDLFTIPRQIKKHEERVSNDILVQLLKNK